MKPALVFVSVLLGVGGALVTGTDPTRNVEIFRDQLGEAAPLSLAINPCTQQNDRGQPVTRGVWHHRRSTALHIDGDMSSMAGASANAEAYNFFNIFAGKTPKGVLLQVCEPDFTEMRDNNIDVCYTKTIANLSALVTSSSDSSHYISVPFQNNRLQMMRYSFEDGWGCFDPSALEPGKKLTDATHPNSIVDCPAIGTHATFVPCESGASQCCDFSCPSDEYIKNAVNRTCDAKCASVDALACAPGERAATVCSDMDAPRYSCAPCQDKPGSAWAAWSAADPSSCQYALCAAGTVAAASADGCGACPVNTYAPSSNLSACVPCAMGTEAALGQASCTPCFQSPLAEGSASCDPGSIVSRDATALVDYLNSVPAAADDATDVARAACERNFACLPCTPGHFQSAPDTCSPCPLGQYQPGFQQTACISCAVHQTTGTTGAIDPGECVCSAGAE